MGKIINRIKGSCLLGLKIYNRLVYIKLFFTKIIYSDKYVICREYKKKMGKTLNLDNPQTLTEKLQWIKLNERQDFHKICSDKYAVRNYLGERFDRELLIPLLFVTNDYREIVIENIPDVPCIIKSNHDSGHYFIIRNKNEVNFKRLQEECRFWLSQNYYKISKEWQYDISKSDRKIVVEKLLMTKEGKIPNDYKLHYINGELQFIYVSFDREGINDRCTYDKEWNRLPFVWVPANTYNINMNTHEVPRPKTLNKMIEMGNSIAKRFKYVRVDFYDVDGRLYFGEITLHHGSGMDKFFPEHYDLIYGNKLILK